MYRSKTLSFISDMWAKQRVDLSIVTGYRLDNKGFVVWFPAGERDFSLLQSAQAYSASYWYVPGGFTLGVKVASSWSWPLIST